MLNNYAILKMYTYTCLLYTCSLYTCSLYMCSLYTMTVHFASFCHNYSTPSRTISSDVSPFTATEAFNHWVHVVTEVGIGIIVGFGIGIIGSIGVIPFSCVTSLTTLS